MADLTNTFVNGAMNKDLDERLVPLGTYRDALNIDVDTDESSNVGSARNALGNTNVGNIDTIVSPLSTTNAVTIGAVKYEATNLIYWLVNSPLFDAIFEYNEITGVTERVLQCNNISGKTTLNFNTAYIVTGINYINGFLYWTDDFNPPRKINISRAKSYSIDDARIADDIDVILAPPLSGPVIRLWNDGTQSNNISEKFMYFSYRYKYIDGQYSSMSPFSAVAFEPKEFLLDYSLGFNKAMVNKSNSVDITYNTGGKNVVEIQVLAHDVRNLNTSVIESFNKEELSIPDMALETFKFNNNKTYTIIAQEQLTRLFDNVPLTAKAQDFVGNRIMYGNYTQFYDIVDCNGVEINIDLGVDFSSVSTPLNTPIQTWRSDRDYEIGIEYLDKYGRHTTVLTSNDNTVYIPPSASASGNSLRVNINNKPPCWATNYRLVVKQSKKAYYNIFPIIFYSVGVDRYMLINESDRDKFAIGGYVIFKSISSGPTFSNKEYKILELASKTAGQVASGSLPGLYFKVKVDNINELTTGGLSLFYNFRNGTDDIDINLTQNTTVLIPVKYYIPGALYSLVENPIHYGVGDPNLLVRSSIVGANPNTTFFDYRITVRITSPTQFQYITSFDMAGSWITENIVIGTDIMLSDSSTGGLCNIQFNGIPPVNDIWKINIRGYCGYTRTVNYFGGGGIYTPTAGLIPVMFPGGYAPIVCDWDIRTGDIITIQIKDYLNLSANETEQIFTSGGNYENIEEWFNEDGQKEAFISKDTGNVDQEYRSVSFRRGNQLSNALSVNDGILYSRAGYNSSLISSYDSLPIVMIIQGYGKGEYAGGQNNVGPNRFGAMLKIQRYDASIIAETVPKETDIDIYHEVSKTFPIVGNLHKVVWQYADYTNVQSNNLTNLGQLVPGSTPTAAELPHGYAVGDMVYVRETTLPYLFIPTGYYEVVQTPDPYNIVINLNFPGSGAATPGYVAYNNEDVDQTSAPLSSAIIKLNNTGSINSDFNAWAFGNGLESDRIKDDFIAPELQLSPRVNAAVEEYKQRISENAICYSGIYGINTGVNRLNEFNLSVANFKYLDKEFGSIQKLYARDTDMLVFQENKVSQVLYGKNIIHDAAGGGQLSTIAEVLGNQIAYPGEWGISRNPESFAEWGDDIYWTDSRRGSVLLMGSFQTRGNQIIPISSNGMTDYFRDMMLTSPNTQKLGGYDPHTHKYVLSTNNISILKCKLDISRNLLKVPYGPSPVSYNLFTIISNLAWTVTLVNTGNGTSWLTGVQATGYGTLDINGAVAVNSTSANRSLRIVVTYCSTLTKTFTLTQARGSNGNIIFIVNNNKQ
jgi:hypothetical protein